MNFKHIFFFSSMLLLSGCAGKRKHVPENNAPLSNVSLDWADTMKKLGIVHMGDTIYFDFRFRNTGTQPVIIEKAESSCSCTTAMAPEKPVQPGESASVRTILYTQKAITGTIHKTIRVNFAGSIDPKLLGYEAEIRGHKKLPGT